jgi:hypothetical protein
LTASAIEVLWNGRMGKKIINKRERARI